MPETGGNQPSQESSLNAPTIASLLHKTPQELSVKLRTDAQEAVNPQHNFAQRNEAAAKAVATVEAIDAVREIFGEEADPQVVANMYGVFYQAGLESGQRYLELGTFNADGTPKTVDVAQADGGVKKSMPPAYGEANSYAGNRAKAYLPELVRAAGITMTDNEVLQIMQRADFLGVLLIAAKQMGVNVPQGITYGEVTDILEAVVSESDGFRKDGTLGTLKQYLNAPERKDQEMKQELYDDVDHPAWKVIDLGLRLAHATWEETQASARYAEEVATKGKSDRLERTEFNPPSVYMKQKYDGEIQRGQSATQAFIRTVWEVFKDKKQYS